VGLQRTAGDDSRAVPPQRSAASGGARLVSALLVAVVLLTAGLDGGGAWAQAARRTRATLNLDDVAKRAEALAREPYRDTSGEVPRWLSEITYDQWRDIRYRPELAIWREANLPFQLQFFHPGLFYNRVVRVNVVDAQGVHPVTFNPSQFDYGRNEFGSMVPQDLGYAGLRLHYPIKRRDYFDEVIVFLGASYFRAVGRDLVYGLSARAVAVDTASPSGEEFPHFREFWVERPSPGQKTAVLYALLDSRRLTGAYRFELTPGVETKLGVESRLFFREPVGKLGVAPFGSMFFHGENSTLPVEDFRPEVHDSDGILLQGSTGEWLWRPLDNRERLQVSSFDLPDPKGFGLIERDRNFDHYQDLEARFDLRPSGWVVPGAAWGGGRIELVEIPTDEDVNDNVVAYWVPERPMAPGAPTEFSYTVWWYSDDPERPPGGRVEATRIDRRGDSWRFVIDFDGKQLEALPSETVLQGVVTIGAGTGQEGELVEQRVEKNPVTGGFRLVFRVRPSRGDPLPLRAFLQRGDGALTETWSYLLTP
jgi:glucans biosynthesis protein